MKELAAEEKSIMNVNYGIKRLAGYEDLYEIDNQGNFFSLPKSTSKKYLKLKLHSRNDGYVGVILCKNGKHKTYTVHKLVMENFCGKRPVGSDIDHINANKSDNSISNLRYVSRKENMKNAVRNGFKSYGEFSSLSMLKESDVIEIKNSFGRLKDIAERFSTSQATISRIRNGLIWKHIK